MNDIGITLLLITALFLILGSGVWIGLTLTGVVDDTTARLINAEVGSAASGDLKVRGTIRSASGSPVAGATVRAPLLPRRGLPKLPRLDGNATTPRTSTRWRFLGLRTW